MSYASAARHYYDPPDPEPTCDICDEPMDRGDDPEPWLDWNSETGCHLTCEQRQVDEEDGRVLIAGILYDADVAVDILLLLDSGDLEERP